jgi:hypothetical protein
MRAGEGRPGRDLDGPRDCGAFFLDVVGQFPRDELLVRWTDQARGTNHEIERLIEIAWHKALLDAEANDRTLFDAPLCRLADFEVTGGRLELTLGATTYKEFVGTNYAHSDLWCRFGPEVLANALGVSAAVVTPDGYILLARRSQRVYAYPGRVHPIAGTVPVPPGPTPSPDPFEALATEIHEELGLPAEAIGAMACIGLVRDKRIVQPDLIFEVPVTAEVEAIRAPAAAARGADENDRLEPILDDGGAVVAFLETHCADLTPVASATLLLHGQRRWGTGWFAAARGYLHKVV